MTNLKIETNENTETFTMNMALTKEKFIQAIKDFKAFNLDADNKPYKDTYGTKYDGNLRFTTYIFYAMLKGMNTDKTTHSVDSEKYKDRVLGLGLYAKDGSVGWMQWEVKEEMALIAKCFKSLSEEDIKNVISHYFANKQ